MNEVRWGVIGAGDVCERKSGPPLYQAERSRLELVHRRDRSAGETFARRHAGRYVATLSELLDSEEIDAVYVASPHALHAEHTIAALEAGKHVLVEKPMALSAPDCDSMIRAARDARRSLGVAYYRRGYPSVARVRQLLAEGAVGDVTEMSINSEFPTSHRLDLVHHLLGSVQAVRLAAGAGEGYRFERTAGRIQARCENGAVVTLADTWTETGMPEAFVIRGTNATIHLTDLKAGSIVIHRAGGREKIEVGGLPFTHWGLMENYVAHLVDGVSLLCDGNEGRKSTVILDALAAADASGEWHPIHY